MARTYSKVPEPRYVERAKYADNGGGGGGPEIFEARFNNTTYEELKAAYDAGKLIYLRYPEGNYLSAIAHYDRGPIQFCSQIDDTYCQIFTCNRDDSWTQELVEFQKAGLIVHFTMTSQTTATADISTGEIYNAFSAGRSVMCNVDFLGRNTYIKLSVVQHDPTNDTYNAEWTTVSVASDSAKLNVGLTDFVAFDDTNWSLYTYNLIAL